MSELREERSLLALAVPMTFRNRIEAARELAWRLRRFSADNPLVLGIPRGGVPMARVVADRIGAPLDVALVGRLRAPSEPALTIGSIDESGHVCLADFAREHGVSREYLQEEAERQLHNLRLRRHLYTGGRLAPRLFGRTVILVDDDVDTMFTMVAAIRAVRLSNPARVIVAVGVAPSDLNDHLENEADEVVCLYAPSPVDSIRRFFDDYSEVTDAEVIDALSSVAADSVSIGGHA